MRIIQTALNSNVDIIEFGKTYTEGKGESINI